MLTRVKDKFLSNRAWRYADLEQYRVQRPAQVKEKTTVKLVDFGGCLLVTRCGFLVLLGIIYKRMRTYMLVFCYHTKEEERLQKEGRRVDRIGSPLVCTDSTFAHRL